MEADPPVADMAGEGMAGGELAVGEPGGELSGVGGELPGPVGGLPTMADLDRLSRELDDIDAVLVRLDAPNA